MNNQDLEDRINNLEAEVCAGFLSFGKAIGENIRTGEVVQGCISFIYLPGMIFAIIFSYSTNYSILWAILHGYLSWLYVIYNLFF